MAGSDLFSGSLDLLILRSLGWGPMHGYAIGRWIRLTTNQELDLKEGALYPALHRLERNGYLDEQWGLTETNREAKFYRLSAAGRQRLKSETTRWERYARMMTTALSAPRVPRTA